MAMDAVLINYGSTDKGCIRLRDHLYTLRTATTS